MDKVSDAEVASSNPVWKNKEKKSLVVKCILGSGGGEEVERTE